MFFTLLSPLSRRRFLKELVVMGSASLLLPAQAKLAEAESAHWVIIGPTSRFKTGTITQVTLPDAYENAVIYIRHLGETSYLALSARCTHKGCTVMAEGNQFVCPCHNGRYDKDGKNIGGPPPRPLQALETKIDNQGILSVQVSV